VKLLLKNGRLLDPAQGIDENLDLLLEGGKVSRVGKRIKAGGAKEIDLSGLVVCPGFIDMHVHLREPGQEWKESVESGTEAAAAGGFTGIACMPNTDPVNDSRSVTEFILKQARAHGAVHVYPIGCVTKALEYSKIFDVPIIDHCEDCALVDGGVMHEGEQSTRLGLKGWPGAAEDNMVQRDILLAEYTGGHVHIAHLSTARSLGYVRAAKRRKLRVSCEVTPHHLTLTDEVLGTYDTDAKMNPPLRSSKDLKALLKGLADGTVDAIATDHAPHLPDEKCVEFSRAPFGVIGLETALPVCLDRLVHKKVIGLPRLVELFTTGPARVLHLDKGTLAVGADADVTVLDPDRLTTIAPEAFRSKSRNTPFKGWTLRGMAVMTVVAGRVVHDLR